MIGILAKALTGALTGPLVSIAEKYLDGKIKRDTLEAEVQKAVAATGPDIVRAQADVIIAEAKGDSWLQRNWRPITAILFVWIVFWFGWLQPLLVGWWGLPPLRVGDTLLIEIIGLVKLCLGGYIGARTVEKVASTFRGS